MEWLVANYAKEDETATELAKHNRVLTLGERIKFGFDRRSVVMKWAKQKEAHDAE